MGDNDKRQALVSFQLVQRIEDVLLSGGVEGGGRFVANKHLGLMGEGIPSELEKAAQSGKGKYIYLIPNFQNPTGITMPLERRKEIYAIASKYDLFIYEDDPYGEIRFAGEHVPTFKSFDTENREIGRASCRERVLRLV